MAPGSGEDFRAAEVAHQQAAPEEETSRYEQADPREPEAPRQREARLYLARWIVEDLDFLAFHPSRRRWLDFLAGEPAAKLVRLAQFGAEPGELPVRRGEDDDGEILDPVARLLAPGGAFRAVSPLFIDAGHFARQPDEVLAPTPDAREFGERHAKNRDASEGEDGDAEAEEDFDGEWLVRHGGYRLSPPMDACVFITPSTLAELAESRYPTLVGCRATRSQ